MVCLRRPAGQGSAGQTLAVAGVGENFWGSAWQKRAPLSPAWTSDSSFLTHFPTPQPPLGIEGSSQIKIAGKEQPLIVLRKRSKIRQVSCGVETTSHTAVIRHRHR